MRNQKNVRHFYRVLKPVCIRICRNCSFLLCKRFFFIIISFDLHSIFYIWNITHMMMKIEDTNHYRIGYKHNWKCKHDAFVLALAHISSRTQKIIYYENYLVPPTVRQSMWTWWKCKERKQLQTVCAWNCVYVFVAFFLLLISIMNRTINKFNSKTKKNETETPFSHTM